MIWERSAILPYEEYKKQTSVFPREKLDLKLHPDKSQVLKLEKGVGFLMFYHHKLLAKKNMRKFEKKMEQMREEYKDEKLDKEKVYLDS